MFHLSIFCYKFTCVSYVHIFCKFAEILNILFLYRSKTHTPYKALVFLKKYALSKIFTLYIYLFAYKFAKFRFVTSLTTFSLAICNTYIFHAWATIISYCTPINWNIIVFVWKLWIFRVAFWCCLTLFVSQQKLRLIFFNSTVERSHLTRTPAAVTVTYNIQPLLYKYLHNLFLLFFSNSLHFSYVCYFTRSLRWTALPLNGWRTIKRFRSRNALF